MGVSRGSVDLTLAMDYDATGNVVTAETPCLKGIIMKIQFLALGMLTLAAWALLCLHGCSGVYAPGIEVSDTTYVRVPEDYATVQAAIDSSDSGTVILIAPGTYVENLEIKRAVTLKGDGAANSVVIDGNQQGSVVSIYKLDDAEVRLENLRLQDGTGHAPEPELNPLPGTQGGAIWCFWSTVYVTDCLLVSNQCQGEGGAVYLRGATATFDECAFSGNDSGRNGGAIYSFGAFDPLSITNCTFETNTSANRGGAIYAERGQELLLTGCVLAGNVSDGDGGAVGTDDSMVSILSCTFVENRPSGSGAIVWIQNSVSSSIRNSILAFNQGQAANVHYQEFFTHTCNCLYQNSGGNYPLGLLDPTEIDADPIFCNRPLRDYRLHSTSPCLNAAGCGRIGALGGGC
jgi:predicted outer membrane repeat protein